MYEYFNGDCVYGTSIYVDDYYMDERWAYIPGCPGYMISDKGRVWSSLSGQFIKPKPMDREGHLGVSLMVNGERKYRYIHRLMAMMFIPNPKKHPIVRHLNDDRNDNSLDNLAWGTHRDNAYDAIRNGKNYRITEEDREKGLSKIRKPILAINTRTDEEMIFESQTEAARVLGVQQANIWKVLNKQRPLACGYYFEYLEGGADD